VDSSAAVPPVARALVLATAAIWVILEVRQSLRHRADGVKAGYGSEIAFRLVVVAGVFAALGLSRAVPDAAIDRPGVAAWIGLALLWCGVVLRFWSFRTLGRYFTFVVQTSGDQPVIDRGPYRAVRHPSYAGLLLAVLGLALFIENWLSVAGLVVAVGGGLVFRIHVEERALLDNLGDAYRDYAATHKRLIPFVW
jgi:protein-S-isoprenylcysteine O-methyltransferase Ste14